MSLLTSIKTFTRNMIDTYQKSQVMRTLMELSNEQLEDIGVSRNQLERGLKAYPWRNEAELPKQNVQAAQVLSFKRPTPATPVMASHANAPETKQAA